MSRKVGRVPAVIGACVLAAVVVAANFAGGRQLTGGDDSATGRVQAWSEGLQMLKAQPVLGVGYGQFVDHNALTAHNSFVLCFSETGLLGYFFWLGLLLASFICLRTMRALPLVEPIDTDITQWAGILQLSLFAFLAAAFFLSRTFVPMLYLLLGLVVALLLITREAGRRVSLPPMPQFSMMLIASEIASIASIYVFIKLHIA
jgi:putative inorganic carbon (HCO3(-)) transporter